MKHNKLYIKQDITKITFKEEWKDKSVVIYPDGLGKVRDLIPLLPLIKRLNVKFFLDCAKKENYDAVQILSSLGIYSGIVIDENADWERLTDLMYYALCGKVAHAPIEPFQYVYDMFDRNKLVDYGVVFNEEVVFSTEGAKNTVLHRGWQRLFYERTDCAACEGWRICLGKYAALEDKSGCQSFMAEFLQLIESLTTNH